MNIDVYDTWATTTDGRPLHFDVLVPGGDGERAAEFARRWLRSMRIDAGGLRLQRCRFCHSRAATPEIARAIARDGYFVVQLEGCPAPV